MEAPERRLVVVKRGLWALLVVLGVIVSMAGTAAAAAPSYPGVEHLHFNAGPYRVTPGANLILLDANDVLKPSRTDTWCGWRPTCATPGPTARAVGRSRPWT
jgi:hypothetical protein